MSIVKTDIVTQFGAHYIPEGQNMERLKSMLRVQTSTVASAKLIIHDGDLYRFSNVIMSEVVQNFQKGFTPKGDATFKPNEIRLRNIKSDVSLYPDDVKSSWLGFLSGLEPAERAQWPIVRYMLEMEVVPQIKSDMETKVYWGGKYSAATPGTASAAQDSMDGIKELLDAGLAASDPYQKMNAVTLTEGTLSNSNIFEQIEEFAEQVMANQALEGIPVTIHMSKKNLRRYLRDKRNTHGNDVNYAAEKITIDFSDNIKLEGHASMGTSDYLWATPDDNFLYVRRENGMKDPKVEEAKREVALMVDWWEGIGFGYNPLVYVWAGANPATDSE